MSCVKLHYNEPFISTEGAGPSPLSWPSFHWSSEQKNQTLALRGSCQSDTHLPSWTVRSTWTNLIVISGVVVHGEVGITPITFKVVRPAKDKCPSETVMCYKQWHVRPLLHILFIQKLHSCWPVCTLRLKFCCLTSGSEEDHYGINISHDRGSDFAGPQSGPARVLLLL